MNTFGYRLLVLFSHLGFLLLNGAKQSQVVVAAAAAGAGVNELHLNDEEEENDNNNADLQMISDIIDWLKQDNDDDAYINEKVEVRPITNTLCGLFAVEDIKMGETISSIPWNKILMPDYFYDELIDDDENDDDEILSCELTSMIYDVITKPPKEQTPYEKYLSTRTHDHLIPTWTFLGRNMVYELIVGNDDDNNNNSNPSLTLWQYYVIFGIQDSYQRILKGQLCKQGHYSWNQKSREDNDPEALFDAIMISLSRNEGPDADHFIPFHDIINHQNGRRDSNRNQVWKQNVQSTDPRKRSHDGKHYQLYTIRDVQKEEQLFLSYNRCPWCAIYNNPFSQDSFSVTPDIFLNYGFVEAYPQRWVIPSIRMLFDIDYRIKESGDDDDDDDDDDDELLEVIFAAPPSNRSIPYLRKELNRLELFKEKYSTIVGDDGPPPKHELESIWEFHEAMVTAYETALRTIEHYDEELISEKVWERSIDDWYFENDENDKFYWGSDDSERKDDVEEKGEEEDGGESSNDKKVWVDRQEL